MKRKIWILIAAVCACSCASVGTLAYYTATRKTENIITAGNVKIELREEGADGEPFPAEGIFGIAPGESVEKRVFVKNVGDNPAWIRIRVTGDFSGADGQKLFENQFVSNEAFRQVYAMDFNTASWTEQDNWYYLKEQLPSGLASVPLFTRVQFSVGMGNEYQSGKGDIHIQAQAVQSRNNGTTVFEAAGWPAE